MSNEKPIANARFSIGDLIHHHLFNYRGVVVDVDPVFQSSDEWYDTVAKSRPAKNQPWYHVLVHGSNHTTYVAQENLEPDEGGEQVVHPLTRKFFSHFTREGYTCKEGVEFPDLW